ncbi:hypothetical protein ADIARSV_1720 [Arcticibacter svalbardensis MN12-7]|uniref:EF-hand domain-containing protein n=1 Tax=Arcticibacter svalbardensis MN12-7 TaxID=1150600 RepID=R9GTR5_9SPHI|nr:hypothetical protein [Arcticibacter svalbardensis]EOR95232.1 hypothetical protein ADIARSV_1720 [Arcticibacter svalbardensis MN12-7]
MKLINISIFIIVSCFCCFSCANKMKGDTSNEWPLFKNYKDINYFEVRREFKNGFSFDEKGYQLEPEWSLYFTSDSAVKVFNSKMSKYLEYPVVYDKKSIVNFARTWFRVTSLSKDSLVLQRLELTDKAVSAERSNVFMTFYSANYIKNIRKTSLSDLRRPNLSDSIYVKAKVEMANRYVDSAFAARNPPQLESRSPIIEVKKIEPEVEDININNRYIADAYLYPEYHITIDNAYNNFAYFFSANIDKQGNITFKEILQLMSPEYVESKKRVVKGIVDVYLKNLLNITPGSTLGFPQNSTVYLFVSGKKKS